MHNTKWSSMKNVASCFRLDLFAFFIFSIRFFDLQAVALLPSGLC